MSEIRTIDDLRRIAKERGWRLNPDTHDIKNLLYVQNKFFLKYGDYYCPCRHEPLPENRCPCERAEREIREQGHCHCKMFLKRES